MKRPKRLTTKGLAQKQRIIEEAAKLFDQQEFRDTLIEDIARAAGVSKATFYHYFESKTDLLIAIHQAITDALIERAESPERRQWSWSLQLKGLMTDILDLVDEHPGHLKVFFEHYSEVPEEYQRAIRAKRNEYQKLTENIIAEGIRAGEFHNIDPPIATLAILGMCNWASRWYRKDGRLSTEAIERIFWQIVFFGLEAATREC